MKKRIDELDNTSLAKVDGGTLLCKGAAKGMKKVFKTDKVKNKITDELKGVANKEIDELKGMVDRLIDEKYNEGVDTVAGFVEKHL